MSAQIIDGRAIARAIIEELAAAMRALPAPLTLSHFVGTDDPAIQSFIKVKRRVAAELGVVIEEIDVRQLATEELLKKVTACTSDGVIVQFPLPEHVDRIAARNAIPREKDVDAISEAAMQAFEAGALNVMPPVAGAIKAILDTHKIEVRGKKAVVIGAGWLVGKPASILLKHLGADVAMVTEETLDIASHTIGADILVLGAGHPGLLTPDMISPGAMVFDAGTSEEGGKLQGDADPACADTASVFTPVPGGIGPITVAMIFKNLWTLVHES